MKKNIGTSIALYPTPLVVVGAMVDGKPNYMPAGHVGIIGHDRVMVSMVAAHYTNQGIRANKALSINMVDEAMLPAADKAGCCSGHQTDKSQWFAYTTGETGAPIIEASPVVMDCRVVDVYETPRFENFICEIAAVYAEDKVLKDGKLDYNALKPVLFEFPTYSYLRTGEVIGKCKGWGENNN